MTTPTEPELLQRQQDGVLWLTLNRPERRNALSPTLYDALRDALASAERDGAVGAVVLSGAAVTFCAGGDVARMSRQPDTPAASAAYTPTSTHHSALASRSTEHHLASLSTMLFFSGPNTAARRSPISRATPSPRRSASTDSTLPSTSTRVAE